MNATIGWVVAVVVALGAAYYIWFMPQTASAPVTTTTQGQTLGDYNYTCENGVKFTMTPAADVSSITLKAIGSAPFTTVTIPKVADGQYATSDGEVSFVGKGEGVTVTVGATTMTCNPVADSQNAPFNWGD